MVKRFLGAILIITMLVAVPAHAASSRSANAIPVLEFNGTQATCMVFIGADRESDKIVATMALWQGSTLVKSWNSSGSGGWKLVKQQLFQKTRPISWLSIIQSMEQVIALFPHLAQTIISLYNNCVKEFLDRCASL